MYQVAEPVPSTRQKRIKIALAGNPNSGKSTLFNSLTGLNQKVANFPGVTVDKKSGFCRIHDSGTGQPHFFEITDLPGTYSLYPKSPDERIPFNVLCNPNDPSYPDMVILIADGTNLKRSLFLASQVIDLKIPVVLALNMMDQVRERGININIQALEQSLGIKVFPVNARNGEGIEELKQGLLYKLQVPDLDIFNTSELAPKVIKGIRSLLHLKSDYAALQIAHHADSIENFKLQEETYSEINNLLSKNHFDGNKIQSYETLERYKIINEILKKVITEPTGIQKPGWTQKIDAVLMHRFWGYVCFLGILFLIFQAIFTWATVPMDFIDETYAGFTSSVAEALPKGVLNDLIVNGILAGIGGIIIFIPQIALLFLFIAVLEDSGYMARVSFLMDKLMRKFGLNGRSVIPLISGVACAVPAIMSTRTIASWKERIITIFVTPLMSCSARLPVYTLLIALIIPAKMIWGVINLQGVVMMALYLIGFFAALGSAALMQWFVKAKEKAYFIMEIPVYRAPRWSNIGYAILEKVRIFLFEAGKIIIAISIILWFLSSRGPGETYSNLKTEKAQLEAAGKLEAEKEYELEARMLESSYAGKTGHLLEPVIEPLGFDWKIGIALVTSFAAREVFVGTMNTIYSVGQNAEEKTVREKMNAEINPDTGEKRYTTATGWSLMLFYAFAMQCMSTMAVVKRETGGWKWPIIQFVYTGALAYISSFVAYQLLS